MSQSLRYSLLPLLLLAATPVALAQTTGFSITSLSPSYAYAGSPNTTLTINGRFDPSYPLTATWINGTFSASLAISSASTTQVVATIPASLLATPGTAFVEVSALNYYYSNQASFSIVQPNPTLTSLSPSYIAAGSPGFTLNLSGTGFTSSTVATWNGTPLVTTYVSSTVLSAAVPASLITTPGNISVSLSSPNGVAPLPKTFLVARGITITSISPASVAASGPGFVMTVNGTGFDSGTSVYWDSAGLNTTYVNSTQLTATVTPDLIAKPGAASITATNGIVTSNAISYIVVASGPVITSISPSSVVAGGAAFPLTINGSGFSATSAVTVAGTVLPTTYVSATQLTATVPVTLIAQSGSDSVTVANGTGSASNSVTLTVTVPTPILTSLSPATVTAGGPGFSLTVNGSGFITGATVSLNGTALKPSLVNANQFVATVPANLVAQIGTASITASNPGGSVSNALTLTIVAAAPAITSISPATVTAGGPAFTLTVTGANFISSSVVAYASVSLATTYVSATQLTAAVPANLIAAPGAVLITVGNSNAVSLTIASATPTITSISPSSVVAGSAAFTLTVTGANFTNAAAVVLDKLSLTTTFVSATQLTASVPASAISQPGASQVTVAVPNAGVSNAVPLTITQPPPTITSLTPSSVTAGGPAFTLTVAGTNFVSGSVVSLDGNPLSTSFVNATQVSAAVPANLIAQAGTSKVVVTTPAGVASNAFPFTITVAPPVPTISSISPDTVTAGGAAFTLTINGGPFNPGAQAFLNNASLNTVIVSATQVTADVPANLIAQPGPAQITVTNQGGQPSVAATLNIMPAPPAITSIAPVSANVGDATFTLTVTGTGFVSASIVQWDGAPLSTTFISPTKLSATIAAGRLILPATATVTVANPGPPGAGAPPQVSNGVKFTINAVPTTVSSVSPTSAQQGGPAFTLTIAGSGFIGLTTVSWNQTALTTHPISATQLTADVPATLLASAGSVTISVTNPGNSSASTATFQVLPSTPTIGSLSKTSATAGDPAFTLTVNGTNFATGATVSFGSTQLATTFVSSTQLTAAVTATLLLTPGTYPVVVQSNGASSAPVSFTVALPAPPTVRLNPPASTGPQQQPTIDFGLTAGYPLPMTGTVTLTFTPDATNPSDDLAIQFATGGRTLNFNVPANSTMVPAVQVQTGTTSGTITIAVSFTVANATAPVATSSTSIKISRAIPVIGKVTIVKTATGIEVDVKGFSTPRDVSQATFHITPVPGALFTSTDFTLPVTGTFTSWFQSVASPAYGSQFTFAQPFTILGDASQVQSVTVTLTNSTGVSAAVVSTP